MKRIVTFALALVALVLPAQAQGIVNWSADTAGTSRNLYFNQDGQQHTLGKFAPGSNNFTVPGTNVTNGVTYVTDYGAKCDGVTDDTAIFTTAATAAVASGKALVFTGTCILNNWSVPTSLSLLGATRSSTLKRLPSAAAFNGVLSLSSVNHVTLANMTIDGNVSNETNVSGSVVVQNSTGINIINVDINNSKSDGLQLLSGTARVYVANSNGTGNLGNDVYLDGVSDLYVNGARYTQGLSTNPAQTTQDYNTNITLDGVRVDCGGNAGVGIRLAGGAAGGQSPLGAPYSTINNGKILHSIIKNCTSTYQLIYQGTNGTIDDVSIINPTNISGSPILFNAINSKFVNSHIEWNATQGPGIGLDAGACQSCSILTNFIGPSVLGNAANNGTSINISASTNTLVRDNTIVAGTGVGINSLNVDVGTYAFNTSSADQTVYGNRISCQNTSCVGIQMFGTTRAVVALNDVTGSTPTNAYNLVINSSQGLTQYGNTWGNNTPVYPVASASTVVMPSVTAEVLLSGTTTVNSILTNEQNTYTGKVPFSFMTNPGSGYTSAPTVTFSGGGCTTLPTAHAVLTYNGTVQGPYMDTNGVGCTSAPTIAFSGGGGTGAAATAQFQINGQLVGRTLAVVTQSALTLTNATTGTGSLQSKSGANISSVVNGVYTYVNVSGVWSQP